MLAVEDLDLSALTKAVVQKRFPERLWQRDEIAKELVGSWLKARPEVARELALRRDTTEFDAARLGEDLSLWDHVGPLIEEIELSFPQQLPARNESERWRHQQIGRLSGAKDDDDSLSLEALSRCAWVYLRSPWADSPALECWLARQMIYAETFAFSRETGTPQHLKSKRAWWEFAKAAVKWGIGVLVALAIGEKYGGGVGVLAYLAWLTMVQVLGRDKLKGQMQIAKLFGSMQTAYKVAMRSTAYPLELERHLTIAEQDGAVWPEGLRPLLHKAMQRNPIAWAGRGAY